MEELHSVANGSCCSIALRGTGQHAAALNALEEAKELGVAETQKSIDSWISMAKASAVTTENAAAVQQKTTAPVQPKPASIRYVIYLLFEVNLFLAMSGIKATQPLPYPYLPSRSILRNAPWTSKRQR